ncbi:tetratricopeptide repeat protein [Haliangium sp.]|uniref:tetratricopeptide repeat protein n=1 Tax=Haliangium sp. TaxID=2663208 RepID=UPI003D0A39B5
MNIPRLTVIHRAGMIALVAVALCGRAHAQPEPEPAATAADTPKRAPEPEPSASAADAPMRAPDSSARRAEALYAEGAALFKQWRFDEAEAKFREALTLREHPVILLYLSRTLDKQFRLVEAHAVLMQALRGGRASMSPEDAQVAEDLQTSLESRLGQLEVNCDLPGTEVSLDGEPWFTAPDQQRRMVTTGQHVLLARAPGYFPITQSVSLIPGKQSRVVLRPTEDTVHAEQRWPSWQPWAVVGAGSVVSITGGLLWLEATRNHAEYENEVEECSQVLHCEGVQTRLRVTGERYDTVGTAALLIGGATFVAGLVGALLNQPHTWRSEPTGRETEFEIVPIVSGNTAVLSARLSF